MKRFANGNEPAVLVPVILKPIKIQVALVAVPVQIRDVAVTVRVLPDIIQCAEYHLCHHPLNTLRIVSNSASIIYALIFYTKYLHFKKRLKMTLM